MDKQLFELHQAYKKHAFTPVGTYNRGGNTLLSCSCGLFAQHRSIVMPPMDPGTLYNHLDAHASSLADLMAKQRPATRAAFKAYKAYASSFTKRAELCKITGLP
jgi:hypothetical protein